MELPNPEQIEIDSVTSALLAEVDDTARKVNEFRPLAPAVVNAIVSGLLGERVYSSNAIEGNTLDLRETTEILRSGYIGIAKKREATEALNLGKAIEHVQKTVARSNEPYSMDDLLSIHRMILSGIHDDWAGRFRDRSVVITGATHQPPNHAHVPALVKRFLQCLDEATDVHPVVLATSAHWCLARIHPFFDGNGRIARLWQDVVLFRNGLTCAVIEPTERRDYLDALEQADDGQFNPLTQFVARRVLRTLDIYLAKNQEDEQLTGWAEELTGETDARASQSRKMAYMRWARSMEQVRYEFERCAAKITASAGNTDLQFSPYDIIDQTSWENRRAGIPVQEEVLFHLDFHRDRYRLGYVFFFQKHFATDEDMEKDRAEPRVGLQVIECEPSSSVHRLGDEDFQTPLSFRELFVVDKKLVRRRFDAETETEVYDRDIAPVKIAQDFIQEVLLRRMA